MADFCEIKEEKPKFFNKAISFIAYSAASDGAGGTVNTPSVFLETMADIIEARAKESLESSKIRHAVEYHIYIGNRSGIVPEMQILYGTKYLEILAITEKGVRLQYLYIVATDAEVTGTPAPLPALSITDGSVPFWATASSQFTTGTINWEEALLALSGLAYLNFSTTKGPTGYGIRDNSGTMEWKNSGGAWAVFGSGGGVPGGSDTQVQFNDGGVFGGDASFVWDKVGKTLTIAHTPGSVYCDLQTNATGNLSITPSGGNVGIGTASPITDLHIYATSGWPFLIETSKFVNTWFPLGIATYFGMNAGYSDFGPTWDFILPDGRGLRLLTADVFGIDDVFLQLTASTSGAPYTNSNAILSSTSMKALGIGTQDNKPIFFFTNTIERLRVDILGNVGINTDPAQRLEVADTSGIQQRLSHTPGSIYCDMGVDASGNISIQNTGDIIAIGNQAGNKQTKETAIGALALASNTGANCGGFGYTALQSNSGISSYGVGYGALNGNAGDYCNGFGVFALSHNKGSYSNGFGLSAVDYNIGGYSNGFGMYALRYGAGAYANAFGFRALYQNAGANCTGLGTNTLYYNQNANNTAIGYNAWSTFHPDTSGNKTFDNTDVNITTDRVTIATHGFGATNAYINVKYIEGTSAITGLVNNTVYQVKIIDANTIGFYESSRGVNITNAGTGTGHTITPQLEYTNSIVIGNSIEPTDSNQINLGDLIVGDLSGKVVKINHTPGSVYCAVAVDAAGNLIITPTGDNVAIAGELYEYGTFAEIYVHDNSTTQSIPTGATYTLLTAWASNGESNNATPDVANDKITITKTGRYSVSCSISGYSGTANVTFLASVFLGGVEQDRIHWKRKFSTANDIGSMSMTGIIDATSTGDVDVRARHDNGGSIDLTVAYGNFKIEYLGET